MRKRASDRQDDILGVSNACDIPMTAYQILGTLQTDEPDIAPPTVYRTMSALTDQRRAHRLESIKAFAPCHCSYAASVPVLAIFKGGGSVKEHDGSGLLSQLTRLTDHSAFRADRRIVEFHGHWRT